MFEFTSHSEEETYDFGISIAETYAKVGAVFAFSGDLGTGKTAIIRGICAFFECEEQVTSPTFTIINEYQGNGLEIIHADLYRLESIDEMLEIGFEDTLKSNKLVLIEWAEKALSILPEDRIEIASFYGDADTMRVYRVQEKHNVPETLLFSPETWSE